MTNYRLIIDLESQLDREATVNMVCSTLDAVPTFELEACYHRELDQEETEPDYAVSEPANYLWVWWKFSWIGIIAFAVGFAVGIWV